MKYTRSSVLKPSVTESVRKEVAAQQLREMSETQLEDIR